LKYKEADDVEVDADVDVDVDVASHDDDDDDNAEKTTSLRSFTAGLDPECCWFVRQKPLNLPFRPTLQGAPALLLARLQIARPVGENSLGQ
jgi:hypothetical protein